MNRAETLLSEDKLTALEAKIKTIPADTPPVKIPVHLDPILKEIAAFNVAQGDALLKHTSKSILASRMMNSKATRRCLKSTAKTRRKTRARNL